MSQKLTVSIDKVKENPDNPRTIKDKKFKNLVNSIKEFPEMADVRELVVNTDYVVLGGNMRFKAMKEAGWTEVPVRVVDWTEEQQREFVIKDNVSGGEWNWDDLANQYEPVELEEWGIDLPKDFIKHEVDEDEAPDIDLSIPVKSVSGQVYKLGRHRLMCGSAENIEDMTKLTNGVISNLVFTYPPYGVSFQSNMRTKSDKFDVLKGDNEFLTEWIAPTLQMSKGFIFIWTSWKVLKEWLDITEVIDKPSNIVIWNKGGGGIGDLKKTFSSDYEVALVFNRGNQLTGKRIGSVWEVSKDSSGSYKHPTQKPVELAATAIQSTTNVNDTVLDVFAGSGSTLIACEQTDRNCLAMEIDERYVDLIRRRYWKYINDGIEDGWEENTPVIES